MNQINSHPDDLIKRATNVSLSEGPVFEARALGVKVMGAIMRLSPILWRL